MSPQYPACYVVFKKGNKALFVLRENTGFMDGMYSLPAGRVEEGEPFRAGAIREAVEEVGLRVAETDMTHVFTQHRRTVQQGATTSDWVDVFFTVDTWQGEPSNMESDKHSKIEWLSLDNLPENIMDYQRHVLLELAAGKSYGEFGF